MNIERIRPTIHFTPKKGWINDPNGPVFFNGEYHLFFQHNPDATHWDNMHWGHAKSKDLIHWEELPIALFPDEQGMIFSGSALVDKENITGFGSKDNPVLLLFYTSHDAITLREMQCLAYTTDCVHFYKYEMNPIIPGKDHTPARDPHVFVNNILGGFSLCITVESAVEFYHSSNLIDWEKTGEFVLPQYAIHGMIECPCLIRDTKDVLMMSMDVSDSEFCKFPKDAVPHNRTMQYFVGEFDGYSFKADDSQNETLLADYGPDFYAGTIFSNLEDNILIAWLGDFSEGAKNAPTVAEGFKGILSYPRKLKLETTKEGYRLRQSFVSIPESEESISYTKTEDLEILTDGCVKEIIKENGFKVFTSYID